MSYKMQTLQEKYDIKLKKTIIEDWNYYYSKYRQEINHINKEINNEK